VPIEPVLIAGEPGLHIESERPAIKVMMIDGIKGFVNGLTTGKPTLRAELAIDYTDRILNPRPKSEPIAPLPESDEPEPASGWERNLYEEPVQPPAPQPEVSRARAILSVPAESQAFDPNNFDFALAEDDTAVQSIPPIRRDAAEAEASPAKPARPQNKSRQQLILGMTPVQLAIIAGLGMALICIMVVFAYVVTTH